MTPDAVISHLLENRLRLRILDREVPKSYFDQAESTLSHCEGVDVVQANPRTGSILIRHHSDPLSICGYAEKQNLFHLITTGDTRRNGGKPLHQRASEQLEEFDRKVTTSTHGQMDLTAVSVVTLLGLSAFQVTQGRLFPPAWTLFQSAMEKIRGASH